MLNLPTVFTVTSTVPPETIKDTGTFTNIQSIEQIKNEFGGKLVAFKNDNNHISYGIIGNDIGNEPHKFMHLKDMVSLTYIPLEPLLSVHSGAYTTNIGSFEVEAKKKFVVSGEILANPLQMREVIETDKKIIREEIEQKLSRFPYRSNNELKKYGI